MGLFLFLGSFSSSSLPGQGCCHFHGEEICLDHSESGSRFAVSSHQFLRYLIWIFCSEKMGKWLISTQGSRDGSDDLMWIDIPAPQLPDVSI